MRRVLSKFGAYVSHLTALSQDFSVKSSDQAKLKGYCTKWLDSKYVLGCAFLDLLSPCAVFSKVMQSAQLSLSTSKLYMCSVKALSTVWMCSVLSLLF